MCLKANQSNYEASSGMACARDVIRRWAAAHEAIWRGAEVVAIEESVEGSGQLGSGGDAAGDPKVDVGVSGDGVILNGVGRATLQVAEGMP